MSKQVIDKGYFSPFSHYIQVIMDELTFSWLKYHFKDEISSTGMEYHPGFNIPNMQLHQ